MGNVAAKVGWMFCFCRRAHESSRNWLGKQRTIVGLLQELLDRFFVAVHAPLVRPSLFIVVYVVVDSLGWLNVDTPLFRRKPPVPTRPR